MTDNDYSKKRRGKLYKIPQNKKICGVCAGIAEYFDVETWVVRVVAVSILLLGGGGGIIIIYFVACWLLDPKPVNENNKYSTATKPGASESSEAHYHRPNVQDVWRKGSFTEQSMSRVQTKFDHLENRMRDLETFVTSDKFSLHRAFKDIQD